MFMAKYNIGIYNQFLDVCFDINNFNGNLESIDNFTSKFENEEELKKYILKNKIIDYSQLQYPLSIVYKVGETRTLPIMYEDHFKEFHLSNDENVCLIDVLYLKSKLIDMIDEDELLIRIIRQYRNDMSQQENLNSIEQCIKEKASKITRIHDLNYAINNFFERVTITINKKTREEKFNYRGYRDLFFLMYNYEMDIKNKDTKEKEKKLVTHGTQFDLFGNEIVDSKK